MAWLPFQKNKNERKKRKNQNKVTQSSNLRSFHFFAALHFFSRISKKERKKDRKKERKKERKRDREKDWFHTKNQIQYYNTIANFLFVFGSY